MPSWPGSSRPAMTAGRRRSAFCSRSPAAPSRRSISAGAASNRPRLSACSRESRRASWKRPRPSDYSSSLAAAPLLERRLREILLAELADGAVRRVLVEAEAEDLLDRGGDRRHPEEQQATHRNQDRPRGGGVTPDQGEADSEQQGGGNRHEDGPEADGHRPADALAPALADHPDRFLEGLDRPRGRRLGGEDRNHEQRGEAPRRPDERRGDSAASGDSR